MRELVQVQAGALRQFSEIADKLGRSLPAVELLIHRDAALQYVHVGWDGFDELATQFVGDANFNFWQRVKHVELGHCQFIDAVQHHRIPGGHGVKPAAPPWATGRGAKLFAGLAEHRAAGVEQLRGEGAFADPGCIGFHHADDAPNPMGRDAGSGTSAAGRGVGTGDKWVGPKINVEQRALRTFEEDLPAIPFRPVE